MSGDSFENAGFEDGTNVLLINMNEVTEASNNPIPAGQYDAIVSACTPGLSKASNQPKWSVEYTVTSEGDYNGRKIFDTMSFSPGALPMTKGSIMKLAPEMTERFDQFNYVAEAPNMVGKQVKVTTKLDSYDGEPQTRVRRVVPMAAAGGFME